jgi:predicted Zn-dependent protease
MQLILVSDSQMQTLGAQSFAQLKTQQPLSKNTKNQAYVRCLADQLLTTIGESPAEWEVQVFEDDSLNAFALPGKKIGVHSGMVAFATRDELAAVMGHEIGHVLAHHGAERVSLNLGLQTVNQLLQQGLAGNTYENELMQALALGSQVGVALPYSRQHESEADSMGLVMMAQSGFQPQAAVSLWQKMQQQGGAAQPEFLSTHPSNQSRIQALQAQQSDVAAIYQSKIVTVKLCAKP